MTVICVLNRLVIMTTDVINTIVASDERNVNNLGTRFHTWPGFVTAHGASMHLHPPDGAFGRVISPMDLWFGLKSAVSLTNPGLDTGVDHSIVPT